MEDKKRQLCKLKGYEVYQKVLKGTSTLEQVADGYNCSLEEFLKEAQKRIDRKDWPRILRASSQNAKRCKAKNGAKDNEKVFLPKDEGDPHDRMPQPNQHDSEPQSAVPTSLLEEMLLVARTDAKFAKEHYLFAQNDLLIKEKAYQAACARCEAATSKENGAKAYQVRYPQIYVYAKVWARGARREETDKQLAFQEAQERCARAKGCAEKAHSKVKSLQQEIRMRDAG